MATNKNKKKKSTRSSASSNAQQTSGEKLEPSADSTEASDTSEDIYSDSVADFKEEYSYVRKDLRHLAIISFVLFAVMFGIGFFI